MSRNELNHTAGEFWITFLTLPGLRRYDTWMPPLGLGVGYVASALTHSRAAMVFLVLLGIMVAWSSLMHFAISELKDREGSKVADDLRTIDMKTSIAQHFTSSLLFFGALIHTCTTAH